MTALEKSSEVQQDPVGDDEPGVASDAAGGEAGPVEGAEGRPDSPLERSDSSDAGSTGPAEDCDGAEHTGRRVISMEVPVHIDQLFAMLFTNSDFFQTFYQRLKYYDVSTSEWEDGENGCKTRRNRFRVDFLGKTGTSTVTEDQTMLPISQPGRLYIINAEVNNAGVPMADLFYTTKHYCIHKLSSKRTQLDAWCQTKFRKSTLFKGFLEKTANEGMDEHHSTLEQMLNDWLRNPGHHKRKQSERDGSTPTDSPGTRTAGHRGPDGSGQTAGAGRGLLLLVLCLTLLLLGLNGFLYVRLSRLGLQSELLLQAGLNPDPEFLARLASVQEQKEQHRAELARWQQAVRSAAQLVRQSEAALSQLQGSIDAPPDVVSPGAPSGATVSPPAAATVPAARPGDPAPVVDTLVQ